MRTTALVSGLAAIGASEALSIRQDACTDTFEAVTAAAAVKALNPGWNLGNTLDATPDEGSWGNVFEPSNFDDAKAAGFKSVRIPGEC